MRSRLAEYSPRSSKVAVLPLRTQSPAKTAPSSTRVKHAADRRMAGRVRRDERDAGHLVEDLAVGDIDVGARGERWLGGVHRGLALVRANALVRGTFAKSGRRRGRRPRRRSAGAHARETADVVVMPVRQEDASRATTPSSSIARSRRGTFRAALAGVDEPSRGPVPTR